MKSISVAKLFVLSLLILQCHNIFGQNTLDLEFISQAKAFSICENSTHYTLFVQNKTGQQVFAPTFEATLPNGLQIVPGSCELSFPAGSPFQTISDPVVASNTANWDLRLDNSYLAQQGLGTSLSDSRFWIRFQLAMDCDYIENLPIDVQMKGESITGGAIASSVLTSDPALRTRTSFTIHDFDVRYTGGVAAYHVMLENLGDSSFVGLNLKFYNDMDDSGTLSPADELQFSDKINFQIGPGQPIPLANGLPVDLSHMCHLIVVLEAEEACLCDNVSFPVDEITRVMYPTTHCSGDLVNVGVPETPGHTYDWSPDTLISCNDCAYPVFQFLADIETTTMLAYHYVETAGDCVLGSDLDVTISPAPVFGNYNDTICAGETAILKIPDMTHHYWTGPGITNPTDSVQVVSPAYTTSYNVTVSNNAGCNTYGIVTVVVKEKPEANIIKDTTSYCEGEHSEILHPLFVNNYVYAWYPVQIFDNPTAVSPRTNATSSQYAYLWTGLPNGCSDLDSIWLDVHEAPELIASNDNFILCNGQNAFVTIEGSDNYTWSPSTNLTCLNTDCSSVEIEPSTETIQYEVSSTNELGCTTMLEITVHPSVQQIETGQSMTLCASDLPFTIFGQEVTTTGEYCQTFTAQGGCDSIHCVQINVIQIASTSGNYSLCEGDTLVLGGKNYTSGGSFCDTLQAISGCDSIVCHVIERHSLPILEAFYHNTINQGEPGLLPLPTGYLSYSWMPADFLSCDTCSIPSFSSAIAEDIVYDVYVESAPGCGKFTEYRVDVKADCNPQKVVLPTAFTPDGDSINDSFTMIKKPGALERIINLRVYNRWGNMVYEGQEWDGKDKGKIAPIGTYIYSLHIGCPDGTADLLKGNVTLLR